MSPFLEEKKFIYHGAHHKMGTVWMMRILAGIAETYALRFTKSNNRRDLPDKDTDILFANHTQFDPDSFGEVVASHMIRDPRDVVVSGYYYHLWTNESWVQQPMDRYGGVSYQELLQSVDRSTGISHEIRRFSLGLDCRRLKNWNFDDPRIFEIRYERLWAESDSEFKKLFSHYGFNDAAIATSLQIAESKSFNRVPKFEDDRDPTNRHLRSGQPGQWKKELTINHCELIKAEFGDLLIKLGYAKNDDWHMELL